MFPLSHVGVIVTLAGLMIWVHRWFSLEFVNRFSPPVFFTLNKAATH